MRTPELRFPEFNDCYIEKQLGEITKRVKRKNTKNETDIPLTMASIEGLVDQRTYFGKTIASADLTGYYLIKKGEFAYNKSYSKGYPVGSIKRLDNYEQGALSTLYICFSIASDENLDSDYLAQYFNSPVWHQRVNEICAEGARNHGLLNVSPDDFFATVHYFSPNINEQHKIASFLDLYDKKIENQRKKVVALEKQRKGFLQKIFTFDFGFDKESNNNWKSYTINDLFDKIKEVNKSGTISNVITNSAVEGLIPQREYFEKDIAVDDNTDKYTVIRNGDFVYNPRKSSSAPYGPFKCYQFDDPGIVSPLYSCLRPKEPKYIPYLKYYFESSTWHHYVYFNGNQGGARHDRVGMTNDLLMGIPVYIPVQEEQDKIVSFFELLDKRVVNEKKKLEAMLQIKKGLLQKMFI